MINLIVVGERDSKAELKDGETGRLHWTQDEDLRRHKCW